MKLLLDTATILWISHDAPKLSAAARAAYLDVHNERFLSVASLWEIIVKNRLGKLPLPAPIEKLIEPMKQSGLIRILPLSEAATYRLQSLPDIHRDPFDRMLVCQAIEEGLTLLTPDATLTKYPVATLW
jgi:PIN domain nuclease of toxin-antitoxin system